MCTISDVFVSAPPPTTTSATRSWPGQCVFDVCTSTLRHHPLLYAPTYRASGKDAGTPTLPACKGTGLWVDAFL